MSMPMRAPRAASIQMAAAEVTPAPDHPGHHDPGPEKADPGDELTQHPRLIGALRTDGGADGEKTVGAEHDEGRGADPHRLAAKLPLQPHQGATPDRPGCSPSQGARCPTTALSSYPPLLAMLVILSRSAPGSPAAGGRPGEALVEVLCLPVFNIATYPGLSMISSNTQP